MVLESVHRLLHHPVCAHILTHITRVVLTAHQEGFSRARSSELIEPQATLCKMCVSRYEIGVFIMCGCNNTTELSIILCSWALDFNRVYANFGHLCFYTSLTSSECRPEHFTSLILALSPLAVKGYGLYLQV